MTGMNPGFAQYLANKKTAKQPIAPGMTGLSHPLLQKKTSVATHVPKGKSHAKVNIKPHKSK